MSSTTAAVAAAAESDENNISGVERAALLSQIVLTPGLVSACMTYQDGKEMRLHVDGDAAAAAGHLSLLRLRRAFRKEGRRRMGSVSNATGGGRSSFSTKNASSFMNTTRRTDETNSESAGGEEEELAERVVLTGREEERDDRQQGGVELGKYALLDDLEFSHRAADWAAAQGHLEVLRWLLETRDEGCTESAVDGACWNGHETIVRWLMLERGQAGSHRALDYAASTGRLELVKWLSRQRGSRCTVAAMDGAAGGGHFEVVRWLAANRREGCSQAAFDLAATGGHLGVITWLEQQGLLRCSSAGLDNAAENGHLHVLQWMLDHKPEHQCSSNSFGLAASGGRLDVCKWLHKTMPGLRCPAWALEIAAAGGHLEVRAFLLQVVRWLHACGLCHASLADLDEVAGHGQLHAIAWLSERGARASKAAVDRAAIAGHEDVVAYLLRNRQEGCSSEAMVGAARQGHLSVVKILRELVPEQCCLSARAVAAAVGNIEVAAWLDESDPELLHALQEAVVSESSNRTSRSSTSTSTSTSGSDTSTSGGNNDGDDTDGGARQEGCDDITSGISAFGSIDTSRGEDRHSLDGVRGHETNISGGSCSRADSESNEHFTGGCQYLTVDGRSGENGEERLEQPGSAVASSSGDVSGYLRSRHSTIRRPRSFPSPPSGTVGSAAGGPGINDGDEGQDTDATNEEIGDFDGVLASEQESSGESVDCRDPGEHQARKSSTDERGFSSMKTATSVALSQTTRRFLLLFGVVVAVRFLVASTACSQGEV